MVLSALSSSDYSFSKKKSSYLLERQPLIAHNLTVTQELKNNYTLAVGGESIDDMVHRISTWVRRCSPSQNDLIVTHAGVIRAFRVLSGQSWDQAIAASCPYLEWLEHHLKG